jgi:hypothetical protein
MSSAFADAITQGLIDLGVESLPSLGLTTLNALTLICAHPGKTR